MLDSEKQRILDRVRKMLALANDKAATEGERDNAMRMAHATLAKYNLDLAMAEKHEKKQRADEPREVKPATFYGRPWARMVCTATARLFFCEYLYCAATKAKDTRHYFIGRQSNAITASLMAEFLVESITKEGRKFQRAEDGGNAMFRSFALGAAASINRRVTELIREATKPKAQAANGSTPGTALVLASFYESEQAANTAKANDYFGEERGKPKTGKGIGDYSAFIQGQKYGNEVSLDQQIGDSNAER